MSTLYFNAQTKVIFGSSDPQDVAHEITLDEVDTLKAGGATVDPTAFPLLGNESASPTPDSAAQDAPAQDASVTSSDTGVDPIDQLALDTHPEEAQADAVPLAAGGADAGNVLADASTSENATAVTDVSASQPESSASAEISTPAASAPVLPTGDVQPVDEVTPATSTDAAATSASTAPIVETPPAVTDAENPAPAASSDGVAGTGDASVAVGADVISNAQADPGGAGTADINPSPAAPNADATATPSDVTSTSVPLADAGVADAAAGSAVNPIPTSPAVAPAADVAPEDEHPLVILAEIEALVLLIGNSAMHEFHRLVKRIADLKGHPQVKEGAE